VDNHGPTETGDAIEGQLNTQERAFIMNAILNAAVKPRIALEVGTWLGGGSTLHILRALQKNGEGHLYGIEADRSIYERMVANIRRAAPDAAERFTPLFGFSQEVIPKWLADREKSLTIDFVFLDGQENPMEQITEFRLLDRHIPLGGQLLSHDARKRKGKYFVPYLQLLDNWETQLHDFSEYGMFSARKIREFPTAPSLKAARKKLGRMRWEPKEIAATILPSWLCGFILRMLPQRLARSLSDEF
jgi:predicted O-methyltransferase YrrM